MNNSVTIQQDIIIRDLLPDDVEEYVRGFRRLSKKSIFHRFNDPIKRLTPGQIRYFTEIDYVNHYACCAHKVIDGRKHGIGVARFVRIHKDSNIAEFAVTVIDEYQGRGIGRALFEHLMEKSKECGVDGMRGYVRYDNAPMLSLLGGYRHRIYRDDGSLLRVELG